MSVFFFLSLSFAIHRTLYLHFLLSLSLGPFGIACKTEPALRRVFFFSLPLSFPLLAELQSTVAAATPLTYLMLGYDKL